MIKFICNRLLKMSAEKRQLLREDPLAYKEHTQKELKRLANPVTGFLYFLVYYGIFIPAKGGGPQPLGMWPYQPRMAKALITGKDVICVKSRRIGFTLIVCHYMVWVCAFKQGGDGSMCVALSKNQDFANAIISLCRDIIKCLPNNIRPKIGAEAKDEAGEAGRETQSFFSFPERRGAYISSLSSNARAARGITATVLFIDEMDWLDNPDEVWLSAESTTEGGGQNIIGSTGNGSAGIFHWLWKQANMYGIMIPVFVAWWERGDRDEAWYERKKKKIRNLDKLRQEFPSTPDEAFAGDAKGLKYSGSAIEKAVKLGTDYRKQLEAGKFSPKGGIEIGIDWGLNSACVFGIPLPGHGWYIVAEYVTDSDEVGEFSMKCVSEANQYGKKTKSGFKRTYYDSAGALANRTFKKFRQPGTRVTGIPFSKYKHDAAEYANTLLEGTAKDEQFAYVAIDPSCKTLIEQLQNAHQKVDGTLVKGTIRKPDHTLDAFLTLIAKSGVQYQLTV